MSCLAELLLKSRSFGSEYGSQLSNHLPMALIALSKIGASEIQMKTFFEYYSPRLKPAVPGVDSAMNWRSELGKHANNLDLRQYFLNEITRSSWQNVVSTYLNELAPGVSGAAFHPLIRLAYAVEIQDSWEIAEALASWVMAFHQLSPQKPHSVGTLKPTEALASISSCTSIRALKLQGPNIFTRMGQVALNEDFQKIVAQAKIHSQSLAELARLSLDIYDSTNDDFTALHCVTASHAGRVLLPYIEAQKDFLWHLWEGIAAAYVTIDCPAHTSSQANAYPRAPAWSEIFENARDSRDDHCIKFSYTAQCEYEVYGDERYRKLAALKANPS